MKIKNIKISKYKKFKELDLTFDSGVNVVVGDNEAGKSTLAQAIMDLLYVDPSTKAGSFINSRRSWGTSQMPDLEMTFFALQSKFSLNKNFQKKTVLLKNLDTKKQVDTYKESLENIKKIIGVTSETVYRKTAFINQGDVAIVDSSDDLLHEITDLSSTGGGQNGVQKIIKNLQSELNQLNRGIDRPANNPGPIKTQQDKIKKLTDYINEKRLLWEKKQSASNTQDESGSEINKVSRQIEEINELLNNYKIAKEANANLKQIVENINNIEEKLINVEKLRNEIESLKLDEKKYEKFSNPELDNDIKKLIGLEQSIKLADKELKNLDTETDVKEQKIEQIKTNDDKKWPINSITHVLISLIFLISALFFYFSQGNLSVTGILIALGFFVNLAFFLWAKLNAKSPQVATNNSYEDSLNNLKNDLTSRIKSDQIKLSEILKKYEVPSIDQFYSLKADYFSIKAKHDDLHSQEKIILGGEGIEALKNRQRDLLIQKKEIETNILTEKVLNTQLTPEKYLEKSRELDKLDIKLRKLKEDLIASKTRVKDSNVDYSEIVSLDEDLDNSKKYLSDLIRKQKVLQLTISTMQEAVMEVSKSANKVLEKVVSDKLGKITANHYSKIKVKSDLSIEVFSNDKNDWVDPIHNLSRGTIDQIYFLVRLGFLRLITENKSIPIILDDPFVTADAVRREALREVVQEVAKQNQVILFTNDFDYTDWGNTIVLPSKS